MPPHDANPALYFDTPDFLDGINVTVRKGRKWDKRTEIGSRIHLVRSEDNAVIGIGDVVGKVVTCFECIPESFCKREHDPDARTKEGLRKVMKGIYGDINPDTTVTVLLFAPAFPFQNYDE